MLLYFFFLTHATVGGGGLHKIKQKYLAQKAGLEDKFSSITL